MATFYQSADVNGFITTLASELTISADTIELDSVTDLNFPGILVINRINSEKEETPADREFVSFTGIAGTTLTGVTRGIAGSGAKGHASGAVVEEVMSTTHWLDLMTLLEVSLDSDGTIKSGATITSPVINTAISGTAFLDEDDMASNSATKVASQQSIKAYVDTATKSIVLPAGSMSPTTTAGCASIATVEAGTNDVDYKVLDFDKATEENAFVVFAMPDSWNAGTITATFLWTTTVTSGDVIWAIKGRAFANDDAIDQAYGTAVTVTDTAIASGDVHISSATGAMTFAGSPAGGQLVQLKIYRDADAGGDTADADARLIAVKIEYGVNAHSD